MYSIQPRVLCVDDEPNVLEGLGRNLRRNFDVATAAGPEAGLRKVEQEGPFAVVMSDQRMPGMDGVTFLSRVREISPESTRVLLTGYADTDAAIAAVNRGAVFRFLRKPIEPQDLLRALTDAAEQHRLITAERVLLERTLHGSIQAIIDVLALLNPAGFGRARRVKELALHLAEGAGATDPWRIEIAAMMSQVGSGALRSSPAAAAAAQPATSGSGSAESSTVERLSRITTDMLATVPRMEEVHAMLRHHDLRYDGVGGPPGCPREGTIPVGARILKLATDLDALESQGASRAAALETLRGRRGWYDPRLLDVLGEAPVPDGTATFMQAERPMLEMELRMVQEGMILEEDVRTPGGRVLIARGDKATYETIKRVKTTLDFSALRQVVRVRKPATP
jgi:response regulator RpfG family c-di-GMP phosphodiesterase